MNGLLKSKQEPDLSATTWLCEANHTPSTTLVFMYFIALFFMLNCAITTIPVSRFIWYFSEKKTPESIQNKQAGGEGKKKSGCSFYGLEISVELLPLKSRLGGEVLSGARCQVIAPNCSHCSISGREISDKGGASTLFECGRRPPYSISTSLTPHLGAGKLDVLRARGPSFSLLFVATRLATTAEAFFSFSFPPPSGPSALNEL